MRSWLVKMEIQVMLTAEGEWGKSPAGSSRVQQFWRWKRSCLVRNPGESCDGGRRCTLEVKWTEKAHSVRRKRQMQVGTEMQAQKL